MTRTSSVLVLAAILFCAPAFAKDIRVGGGAAPINNIFKRVKDAFEKESGHKLVLSEDGPDVALMELDKGNLDLATAGLPYADWVKLLDAKNYILKKPDDIKYRTIGRDLVQVYVSPDVSVTELSKDQLNEIFSGRVTNWKAVGGSDGPITIIFGEKIPGTNKVWEKEILGGGKWAKNVKKVGTAPEIGKTIAATKGSIGIGPIGLDTADAPIRTVRTPVVGRPIMAATMGIPSPEVSALYDFLVKKGKQFTKE
jgi:phosphate transport system substrate-binding protein